MISRNKFVSKKKFVQSIIVCSILLVPVSENDKNCNKSLHSLIDSICNNNHESTLR